MVFFTIKMQPLYLTYNFLYLLMETWPIYTILPSNLLSSHTWGY